MPAISMSQVIRERRLRALGVTPYCLRGKHAPDAPAAAPLAVGAMAGPEVSTVPCVLLLPGDCPQQSLDLVGRAMHAFGADFARAPRVAVPTSGLRAAPPPARAYLAFGEAQARALGHVLDAAAMREVEVVLLDLPEALGDAASKQRLWLALKALRRRLRMH